MSAAAGAPASTMSNWKNVNNWHWVEKNCSDWSHGYIKELLKGIISSNEAIAAKIKSVDSVEGEVDINVRKGKVLYFYDLRLIVHWRAESLDKKVKATGSFVIPEYSPDIKRPQDLVFQISFNDPPADAPQVDQSLFRSNLASVLREPIYERLLQFRSELETIHGASLLVPAQGDPAVPSPQKQELAEAISHSLGNQSTRGNTGPEKAEVLSSAAAKTATLKQRISFATSPEMLFEVLTDPVKIAAWARGPPVKQDDTGTMLSLFDGNVQFEFLERVPGSSIKMHWRMGHWPSQTTSAVTISFERDHSHIWLNLIQTGIPVFELDRLDTNWKEYYWNPIKRVFGFGTDFN